MLKKWVVLCVEEVGGVTYVLKKWVVLCVEEVMVEEVMVEEMKIM